MLVSHHSLWEGNARNLLFVVRVFYNQQEHNPFDEFKANAFSWIYFHNSALDGSTWAREKTGMSHFPAYMKNNSQFFGI